MLSQIKSGNILFIIASCSNSQLTKFHHVQSIINIIYLVMDDDKKKCLLKVFVTKKRGTSHFSFVPFPKYELQITSFKSSSKKWMLLSNNNKTSVLFTSGNFTRTTLVSKLQMLELEGSNCGSLHCLIVSCHKQCVLPHLSQIYCCKIKILAVVSIFQGQNPSVTDSELLSKIKNT